MVDQHSGDFLLGEGFGQKPGDGQVLEARQVAGVDGGGEHEDHALPLGRGQLLVGFEERKPVHYGHVEVEEVRAGQPDVGGWQWAGSTARASRPFNTVRT